MKTPNEKREVYRAADMEVVEMEKQDVLTYSRGDDIQLPDIPIPMGIEWEDQQS